MWSDRGRECQKLIQKIRNSEIDRLMEIEREKVTTKRNFFLYLYIERIIFQQILHSIWEFLFSSLNFKLNRFTCIIHFSCVQQNYSHLLHLLICCICIFVIIIMFVIVYYYKCEFINKLLLTVIILNYVLCIFGYINI